MGHFQYNPSIGRSYFNVTQDDVCIVNNDDILYLHPLDLTVELGENLRGRLLAVDDDGHIPGVVHLHLKSKADFQIKKCFFINKVIIKKIIVIVGVKPLTRHLRQWKNSLLDC
jgi:hypothetical protein